MNPSLTAFKIGSQELKDLYVLGTRVRDGGFYLREVNGRTIFLGMYDALAAREKAIMDFWACGEPPAMDVYPLSIGDMPLVSGWEQVRSDVRRHVTERYSQK